MQERADHIAEWVALTNLSGATCATKPGAGRHSIGGVRAAIRDLGIDRTEAQRAVKIAGISNEARQAADDAGLTTQTARLQIANAPDQVAKVADLKRQAEERKTAHKTGDDIVTRDAADDAAQMIVDFLPEMRLNEMVGYLDASRQHHVGEVLQ